MKNNQIVINTLVLQQQHDKGQTQTALVDQLVNAGIWRIELRREYFHFFLQEMEALNYAKLGKRLTLFYSVPDVLFIQGQVNPKLLQYFAEAKLFGASYVKLNVGDFASFHGDLQRELGSILPESIELNVENDQTPLSGSAENIESFLKNAKDHHVKVGFVNDLGNWVFTKQDPFTATKRLNSFTNYLHVKDYVIENGQPKTVAIDQGNLDWRALLNLTAGDLPVALEYPVESMTQLQLDISILEKYIESRP
ncbi:MAG: sugar phosphate isomerase [Oenococcus sp.]|uniref:sugar phosphate isomerase/epimerase family protein n=1 Tax=Oenococcus sp. TaxID=1979414 RepID=UPI0039E7FF70